MVEKEAANGNPQRFALPRPMAGKPNADFSLSGLKTALRLEAEKIAPISDEDVRDLCASFQQAVVDVVADRLRTGMKLFRERYGTPSALVAAGGVAANQAIRKALHRIAFEVGTVLVVPPPELCTDNGAMIAWAGAERLALGLTDTLDTPPHARWPLDRAARRAAAGADAASAGHAAEPAHDLRAHRRGRRRRLGQRARERGRARRPHRDAVGARPANAAHLANDAREPVPARRADRRRHRDGAATSPKSRGRDAHPAGGAGAGDARSRHGARAADRAAARR